MQLALELTWLEAAVRWMLSDVVGVLVVDQEAILRLSEGARWDFSNTGKVPSV